MNEATIWANIAQSMRPVPIGQAVTADPCSACSGEGWNEDEGIDDCAACDGAGWTDGLWRCKTCQVVVGASDSYCAACQAKTAAQWAIDKQRGYTELPSGARVYFGPDAEARFAEWKRTQA